nr:MAG TPA: hypothetical protein [Caudoviricetes sp.]
MIHTLYTILTNKETSVRIFQMIKGGEIRGKGTKRL